MTAQTIPLISVALLAPDSLEKLDALLISLNRQTHQNLEILVSGESLAGPAFIYYIRARQVQDNRIRYVVNPGLHARETALMAMLNKASGEYFVIATDMLIWDARFLERCVEEIGNYGSVMCTANVDGKPVSMPAIGKNSSRWKDLASFLSTPTTAMLLGLHRTSWFRSFAQDVTESSDLMFAMLCSVYRGHLRVFQECLCDLPTAQSTSIDLLPEWVRQTFNNLRALAQDKTSEIWRQRRRLGKVGVCSLRKRICRSESRHTATQSASESARQDGMKASYSQSGEDMVIDFIFYAISVPHPTYLDIGAHHPRNYSNTNHFHQKGSRGVNVEADPSLCEIFFKERPADINLNVGVGVGQLGKLPFYVLSSPTLSTFSKQEAQRCVAMGTHRIEKVIDVQLRDINDIIGENFAGQAPDFISIDVEGMDLEIVKSINFDLYRAVVFCIETITFSESFDGKKISEIGEFLETKGYFLFADTGINSIFVDKSRWRHH